MERRIFGLILLFLVLSGVGALQVDIPEKLYEFARGDNITLPCRFTTKVTGKIVVVSWSVETGAKELQVVTYFSAGGVTDIKSVYEGRVSLDVDIAKGKADLKLHRITLDDNKVFECRILVPGDDEGQPADTARLVVLVAPSKPICKIQGKTEYGQNINLTCVSEEGSPPPTYKWQSRDVKNNPRIASARTTDKGGILSLYNITKDSSGYYTCTSTNKIRFATCNVTLTVMPPSMNIGSTAGIIGGVVAALIALIIIIYCCCCRKKKQDEEYAMGVRKEEYSDKEPAGNGESRRADGQEDPQGYEDSVRRPDRSEERSERNYDSPSDYDDRRSDYSDRRDKYSDRRERYDDDRRDDDRRDDDDRRYDDDRRGRPYEDDRDRRYDDDDRDRRYDDDDRDRRYNDDRYDEPYDDRERERPPVPPANKPRRDLND
ncbi:cell surface A33 antigen-like isoform X3 [Labrus mixtus]|uniref:cell surface A33 antigen-like isoform X3 n=1 Tax=Labrus mixtus TaxID=508554 RepID=UPI0029C070BC|nr:cell surface A33 antigen-like isoform X3 [Labrus mixtus]